MYQRAFVVVSDERFFRGLWALLNSIYVYYGREYRVFVVAHRLSAKSRSDLLQHPLSLAMTVLDTQDFARVPLGTWEAKQMVFSELAGKVVNACLLDADLVLLSRLDDVFEWSSQGKIVSSRDGDREFCFDERYATYGAKLVGASIPYFNSGFLCLSLLKHWDLIALWEFTSRFAGYSHQGGVPFGFQGHGDQGLLNASAALLNKAEALELTPQSSWCNSAGWTSENTVDIVKIDGSRLVVQNRRLGQPQRLLHSTGPKWWTEAGAEHFRKSGDVLKCFKHFENLFAVEECASHLTADHINPTQLSQPDVVQAIHENNVNEEAFNPRKPTSNDAGPKILIAILSCQKYADRRKRCLNTWVPEAVELGMDVVFVVGGGTGEPQRLGRLVQLPCPDDYASLSLKMGQFYEWALANVEFDYIFKCDDDTYIRAERLKHYPLKNRDYIGAEWATGVGIGSGGAGYWLSRKAVAIASKVLLEQVPQTAEDVLVGWSMQTAGISFHQESRLIPFGNDECRPTPANQLISAHACERPWKVHRTEFQGKRPIVTCTPKTPFGDQLFQVAAVLGYSAKYGTHDPLFEPAAFGASIPSVFRGLSYGQLPDERVTISDPPDFSYDAGIPALPSLSVHLDGYHQSEKYFQHCQDLIRKTFAPTPDVRLELSLRYRERLVESTVSLHVCRHQYLARQSYHPLLTVDYYREALRYLSQSVGFTRALCFSDDPEWCEVHLAGVDPRIEVIRGLSPCEELALMGMCQHHVISNSSFAWWGAWMGENSQKKVIVPDQYLGPAYSHWTEKDLIPETWIRLGSVAVRQHEIVSNGIHQHGYWLTEHQHEHHEHDPLLCQALVDFFATEGGSVVDLGCGPGNYVRAFRTADIECHGYDGNPRTEEFTHGLCQVLDLSSPVEFDRTYDWVLSLEVGEHIPRHFEHNFIQNLHRANSKGIVLSWAVEGQGGHGHVNTRNNSYIRERFQELGYQTDREGELRLRQNVSRCDWFRNTLMVFRRIQNRDGAAS